ncbi:Lrp/AsnC family transcriptional regulator [Arthrobacter sp. NPDC090010]|uniref:Lrp/AsnC family transcriptional regulator n=1 Tax=Arthrobacter sp. NPDC090010 TaxID=3363942 RepID=UPI0037FF9A12
MDFDTQLIRALQEDGRASIHALSERLGQSRATVSARLRTMVSDGTVRVVAAVDPGFLGQHVLAHVSIRVDGPAAPVAVRLGELPETVLVSAVAGVYDLVTEVRLATMPALHDLLARIRAIPGVNDINTLIYTSILRGFFVSEYRGGITLDGIDSALIEQLQLDGRTSYRRLGEIARLSPSAVASRVQRLVEAGVIKISAVEGRSLSSRQLSMGIGLNLAGPGQELVEELRGWHGVEFAALTLGRFDAVITLGGPTAGALHASLERIRSLAGVERTDSWQHLAVFKEDYARTLHARPAH